jgi:hypothetical protein
VSGIEVLSRTQRIVVLPNTSTSLVRQGPAGPIGPQGLMGPMGPAGLDGEDVIDQYVPGTVTGGTDQGVFVLSIDDDDEYAPLRTDAEGSLNVKSIKGNQIVNGTITIPNAGSLSTTGGDLNDGVIDLTKKSLVGISVPAAWTTANLTFQGSTDGGITFFDLYDESGTERSIVVVASRTVTLDPTKFMGCTHLKIRSGVTATPVAQAADRVLTYTTIAL